MYRECSHYGEWLTLRRLWWPHQELVVQDILSDWGG